MISTRMGQGWGLALLGEVGRGTYHLEPFSSDDLVEVVGMVERYAGFDLGLADASNVVLANRYDTLDVLTLDERHFRALRGPRDRPFRLLPADAD